MKGAKALGGCVAKMLIVCHSHRQFYCIGLRKSMLKYYSCCRMTACFPPGTIRQDRNIKDTAARILVLIQAQ